MIKTGDHVWVWEDGMQRILEGIFLGEAGDTERLKDFRLVTVEDETRIFHKDFIKTTYEEAEKVKEEEWRKKVDRYKNYFKDVPSLVDRMMFMILSSNETPTYVKQAIRERVWEFELVPRPKSKKQENKQ